MTATEALIGPTATARARIFLRSIHSNIPTQERKFLEKISIDLQISPLMPCMDPSLNPRAMMMII